MYILTNYAPFILVEVILHFLMGPALLGLGHPSSYSSLNRFSQILSHLAVLQLRRRPDTRITDKGIIQWSWMFLKHHTITKTKMGKRLLQIILSWKRSYGHSRQSLAHEFVVGIETGANKSQKLPKDIQLKEIHPQRLAYNREQKSQKQI